MGLERLAEKGTRYRRKQINGNTGRSIHFNEYLKAVPKLVSCSSELLTPEAQRYPKWICVLLGSDAWPFVKVWMVAMIDYHLIHLCLLTIHFCPQCYICTCWSIWTPASHLGQERIAETCKYQNLARIANTHTRTTNTHTSKNHSSQIYRSTGLRSHETYLFKVFKKSIPKVLSKKNAGRRIEDKSQKEGSFYHASKTHRC